MTSLTHYTAAITHDTLDRSILLHDSVLALRRVKTPGRRRRPFGLGGQLQTSSTPYFFL
jgi:hypothetical protein